MTSPEKRVEQLETLVARLRHDLRGAITPAVLIADQLQQNGDPLVERAAARIVKVLDQIVTTLNTTYQTVPQAAAQSDPNRRMIRNRPAPIICPTTVAANGR